MSIQYTRTQIKLNVYSKQTHCLCGQRILLTVLNTLLSYRITNFTVLWPASCTTEPVLRIVSHELPFKQAVIDESLRSIKAEKVNFKVLVYISLQL